MTRRNWNNCSGYEYLSSEGASRTYGCRISGKRLIKDAPVTTLYVNWMVALMYSSVLPEKIQFHALISWRRVVLTDGKAHHRPIRDSRHDSQKNVLCFQRRPLRLYDALSHNKTRKSRQSTRTHRERIQIPAPQGTQRLSRRRQVALDLRGSCSQRAE